MVISVKFTTPLNTQFFNPSYLLTSSYNIHIKSNILSSAILFCLLIIITAGCKKDEPVQVITRGFSWKFKDYSFQSNIDTVFASPGSVRQYVMIGGTGLSVSNYMIGPRFDFNSLQPGTYNITTEISDEGVIMNYVNITGEIYDALKRNHDDNSKKCRQNKRQFFYNTLYRHC